MRVCLPSIWHPPPPRTLSLLLLYLQSASRTAIHKNTFRRVETGSGWRGKAAPGARPPPSPGDAGAPAAEPGGSRAQPRGPHAAAGSGRFKAVPAPSLLEAPYGPSRTSAALFPPISSAQRGSSGRGSPPLPPPAPRGAGIRHYPGITGLSGGTLTLYNGGAFRPTPALPNPPSPPLQTEAAARRRGEPRASAPAPGSGKGPDAVNLPAGGSGEGLRGVSPPSRCRRRRRRRRQALRAAPVPGGSRQGAGARQAHLLPTGRGGRPPPRTGDTARRSRRAAAAARRRLPAPAAQPRAPPPPPRRPAGSTVENKSGLLIYCSGGAKGGGESGVKGNQSPFSSKKRPFSPGSLRVTLVTTPRQPKPNKSRGALVPGAPPSRATGRGRRRRRDREEGSPIDGGRGAAPALEGDAGPSQRAPCLPCDCSKPRS